MPGLETHNKKGSHQTGTSPRGPRGWCPISGTLTPGSYAREMSPPNVLHKKSMGLMSMGPKMLQETETLSPLKGLACGLTHPERYSPKTAI